MRIFVKNLLENYHFTEFLLKLVWSPYLGGNKIFYNNFSGLRWTPSPLRMSMVVKISWSFNCYKHQSGLKWIVFNWNLAIIALSLSLSKWMLEWIKIFTLSFNFCYLIDIFEKGLKVFSYRKSSEVLECLQKKLDLETSRSNMPVICFMRNFGNLKEISRGNLISLLIKNR